LYGLEEKDAHAQYYVLSAVDNNDSSKQHSYTFCDSPRYEPLARAVNILPAFGRVAHRGHVLAHVLDHLLHATLY
jgi:hypothetical protein